MSRNRPSRAEYDRYMTSERWRRTREGFFRRCGASCKACATLHKVEAHHRTYERFGNERDEDLVALCQRHHALVHQYERRGFSLSDATDKVLGVYKQRGYTSQNLPPYKKLVGTNSAPPPPGYKVGYRKRERANRDGL